MFLTAGTRLGPYEILSAIGAGGMGEVYRARDTRLDRTVAIKVLPEHLSNNPERRQRFEREARAVSSLNHPHICTLYDIGQHGGIDFIVMEYVRGENLAERLLKGPLPIAEVLRYATEIADALDKAHRHGVVHRDLKPSNIMITPSGAKLLDFGVAKLGVLVAPNESLTDRSTREASLTGPGTLLGTVQYMAPEQLEDRESDARTDIFAFGVVVYEMATGKRAFHGRSHASIVGAILKDEPPPISASQTLVPPALDRIVKLCLAKDPDQRWQTAHDLLLALGGVGDRSEQQAVMAGPVKKRWPWLLWASSILLALAFAGTAGYLLRPSEESHPMRFHIDPPEGFALSGLEASGAVAVSPDGRRVAFTAIRGQTLLCVRSLDSVVAQPLAGTAGATLPFWSADSRFLGFFVEGKLRKIDASGGAVLTLCDAVPGPRGGTWNREGTIVFARDNSPLHKISAAGGAPTPVTKLDETRREIAHRWPRFLPDGRHFLYQATGSPDGPAVYIADLEGKERNLLLNAATNGEYALGHLFYLRQTTLMAQRFDPKRLAFEGDAFAVAEQLSVSAPQGRGMFSVSDTGLLAYRAGSGEALLAWVDRNGKQIADLPETADYINPEVSPDGKRIAVGKADPRTGIPDIWLYEVARGLGTRFTLDRAQERKSVWSPDASQIVFNSNRKKVFDLYRRHLTGSGAEELLFESGFDKHPTSWSPDGKFILYHTWADPQTRGDLWILPVPGGQPVPFLKTGFNQINGRFSPDGRWVVFDSDETGSEEIYVTPFPGPGPKWRVSASGGTQARWSRDGREIFYLASDGKLVAASVKAGSGNSIEVGSIRALFALNSAPWMVYDVSPDGNRFLVITSLGRQESYPITLVLNWINNLRR